MRARSLLGFSMLGAFWLSASCGDSSGSGVPGYGVTCTSDKECASYDLLCSVEDKCVQCLEESDCETAESCIAGLCQVPQKCEDSRDCSGDQVCNETAGVCVQCLTNRDCGAGETCAKNSCVTKQACEFTSDCEGGLLCDVDAGACVTCRTDRDCPSRRVCEDNECVVEGAGGTSGGGSGGSGGKSNGGSAGMGGRNGGSGGSGGSSGGGAGGSSGGGAGGMSGGNMGGEGGAPSECDCLTTQACTPDVRCVSKKLIDDFVVCDEEILAIEGRTGFWYADADLDIVIDHQVGEPGSPFTDSSCAAWLTGGEVAAPVDNTFAFVGFTLNDLQPYSLVGNTGLQIKLESADDVQVVIKTAGNGYFAYTLSPLTGSNLRPAPFAAMTKMANSEEETLTATNLATVTEIQFSVLDRSEFALAIHSVTLY